jgi:hypothetical protein
VLGAERGFFGRGHGGLLCIGGARPAWGRARSSARASARWGRKGGETGLAERREARGKSATVEPGCGAAGLSHPSHAPWRSASGDFGLRAALIWLGGSGQAGSDASSPHRVVASSPHRTVAAEPSSELLAQGP